MTKSEYIQQASLILLGYNVNSNLSSNDLDNIVKNANKLADKIFPQEKGEEKEEELDLLDVISDGKNGIWIPKPGDLFIWENDIEYVYVILEKNILKESGETYYIYRTLKDKSIGIVTSSKLKELHCRFIGKLNESE